MGILLCEQNFREVWIRNKSVRAEIGHILHTDTHPHTHTTAAKLVVRMYRNGHVGPTICKSNITVPGCNIPFVAMPTRWLQNGAHPGLADG